jgi:hypothetical protein
VESLLTSSSFLGIVPNWVLLAGAAVLILGMSKKRR